MGCLSWANSRCSSCSLPADIRISEIIPWEIIFWYREIINFSVSGIDFSSLHWEITLAKSALCFRPALLMESSSQWSTCPAARLIDGVGWFRCLPPFLRLTCYTGPLSDLRYMFCQTKEWRQAAEPAYGYRCFGSKRKSEASTKICPYLAHWCVYNTFS